MRTKNALAAVALLALAARAGADESAAFLRLGAGAQGQALAGAASALPVGSDSLFWNPAGLASVARPELGATHALFLGDSYDALSLAAPLGARSQRRRDFRNVRGQTTGTAHYKMEDHGYGVIALGMARLGYAAQEGRGADRRATGSFSASDMVFSLGYARPLWAGLSGGVAVKRVESRIADSKAGATALDAGANWSLGGRFGAVLGASVRNLGQDLRYGDQAYPLPLTFAAGATFHPVAGLLMTAELSRRPKGNQTGGSVGVEYQLHQVFALRAGYIMDRAAGGLSYNHGFSGGFGLKWNRLNLDYALAPLGRLGNVHSFSLRARY